MGGRGRGRRRTSCQQMFLPRYTWVQLRLTDIIVGRTYWKSRFRNFAMEDALAVNSSTPGAIPNGNLQ